MKPTKTQIRAELKGACGRVFKRTFPEVQHSIQGACNNHKLSYGERYFWVTALLWSQGFEFDQAKEAAGRLIRAVAE